MRKFYQSASGRTSPESDEERPSEDQGMVNLAYSGSLETLDARQHWPRPGLEVITEEDSSSDTQSTRSCEEQSCYNIYLPPVNSVDKQDFTRYMVDHVKSGDDMCTDPGCPYNRWLYSGAGYPVDQYLTEWEQDRTRRHFDRIEEIIMSPNRIPPPSARRSQDGSRPGSAGSYPVVTLPKSSRPSAMSTLCCFGGRRRGSDTSDKEDQASSLHASSLQASSLPGSSLPTLPPPYSAVQEDSRCPSRAISTASSCSTCSYASTCSCCRSSEPKDPTAPHAFTLDLGKGAKMKQKKKKKGVAACVPRCNAACCATSTFIIFCLIGLAILLVYLKYFTGVMNEGLTEM